MKQLKRLLIAVGILLGLGSSSAMATLTNIGFNTQSGDGILNPVSQFDWNSNGSGGVYLSNGTQYVPGNTLTPGQQITFVYQSDLSAFNDASNNPIGGLTNLNCTACATGYELTIVTTLSEQVNTFTPDGSGGATATFKTLSGTAKIYIGTPDSNVATGTGFDNGKLILVGSIVSGTNSSFTFFSSPAGQGLGATNISAIINPTFLDTTYFLTTAGLPFFNLHDVDFTAQLAIPPGTAGTSCFFCGGDNPFADLASNSADTFRVDGSNAFTVPEPSSLLLLGSGLLGLAGILRKKTKKAS